MKKTDLNRLLMEAIENAVGNPDWIEEVSFCNRIRTRTLASEMSVQQTEGE